MLNTLSTTLFFYSIANFVVMFFVSEKWKHFFQAVPGLFFGLVCSGFTKPKK